MATTATSASRASKSSKSEDAKSGSQMQMEDGMQEGLHELFLTMLKDIYYAEKQILKSLPKMTKAARNSELKEAFENHRDETAGQIERLEQVFQIVGQKPKGEQCEAIQGIIAEGQEVMEDFKGKPVLDVGLIGAGKAVEHYEIARYSSMMTLAQSLGLNDAAELIEANLNEELKTDQLLDQCGQSMMSQAA